METEPSVTTPSVPLDPDAFTLAYLMANEAECPACGYNVHALAQPRCPECGRPLRVMVVTTQSGFSVPWIILMMVSSLTAGIGLFCAAVVGREGLPPTRDGIALVVLYFIANLPFPLLCLLLRRPFLRLHGYQWYVTAPFLLLSGLMFLIFLFLIFFR